MPLVLEQYFLTGRFHATRWNQNPFEDSSGEWPPSPWRLLRTLAGRWFQYARETGDRNTELRDRLLTKLAAKPPAFYLPPNAESSSDWSSRGLKQYQPTSLEKSDKKKGEPWIKRAQTTLAVDGFTVVPPNVPVLWIWQTLDMENSPDESSLLENLLHRITYFGRAESLSLIRRNPTVRTAQMANCQLRPEAGNTSPVLISDPAEALNVEVLLANNDDRLLRGRRIPPGTTWWHAQRPARPIIKPAARMPARPPVSIMQFAVGGHVFPPKDSWIRVTERFRGTALDSLAKILMRNPQSRFRNLPREQQAEYSLFTGKLSPNQALEGAHLHLRFWLLPDAGGAPTRLVCYRALPLRAVEQEALLIASKLPLSWQYGNPDWRLRFVPLPSDTPLPQNCLGTAAVWETITPYVPPRHVLRRNGELKPGHSIEAQVCNDLLSVGLPEGAITVDETSHRWVKVHRPLRLRGGQTNDLKLGYHVRVQFSSPITGPVSLGHSSHFGLGLFAAPQQKENA
jgi:CRISPR-associated protein Csb2